MSTRRQCLDHLSPCNEHTHLSGSWGTGSDCGARPGALHPSPGTRCCRQAGHAQGTLSGRGERGEGCRPSTGPLPDHEKPLLLWKVPAPGSLV